MNTHMRPTELGRTLHITSLTRTPNATLLLQDNSQRRHLLRFWVDTDANDRPIAPTFAPRSSVAARGGFRVPEQAPLRLPLRPPSRPDA